MGIVFYGSNEQLNLKRAYEHAEKYMGYNNVSHIRANTHPDFMLIRKTETESQISIEIARNINDFVHKKPISASNKTVIIHNVEDLSIAASNSLLKTIEEPPANVEFILTTKRLLSILPTIRSRCSKIRVMPYCKEPHNVREFVINTLDDISEGVSNNIINYLENDKSLNVKFAEENSENVFNFIDIAMHFLAYNNSIENAKKILALQELSIMARNTYPDRQNLLLSAMYISTHGV